MAFGGFNNSQQGSASASQLELTNPASLAAGDLLIGFLAFNGEGETITNPSGFTTLETHTNGWTARLSYKIATAGDVSGNSYTFDFTGTYACQAMLLRITGADSATPIADSSYQNNSVASTTLTAPTCTPTTASSLILIMGSVLSTASISGWALATSSPTFTQAYDMQEEGATGVRCLSAAYGTRPEITATGNGTATLSASRVSAGFMVVVNPAAVTRKGLALLGVG